MLHFNHRLENTFLLSLRKMKSVKVKPWPNSSQTVLTQGSKTTNINIAYLSQIMPKQRMTWTKRDTYSFTAKNTVISLIFVVQKFCGNAQLPHSFEQIAWNHAEIVLFQRISTRILGKITVFFTMFEVFHTFHNIKLLYY